MEITTYSNFRQNLKKFLDNITGNHNPLFVKRVNGEDIVVLSKSDYDSMQETFYLLQSPQNALRLLEGIEEYRNSGGIEKGLIEE
jgi:antitoxin YefM